MMTNDKMIQSISKLDKLIETIEKVSGSRYDFNENDGCHEFHYQEETISFYDHCVCGGACDENDDSVHYSDRERVYNEILGFYARIYNEEDLI